MWPSALLIPPVQTLAPVAEIRNNTNLKNDTSVPAGWRAALRHSVERTEQVLWINWHVVGK